MAKQRVRSTPPRRNRAQADSLAANYTASDLTRAEFCRQHGLVLSTLVRYVRQWRRDHPEAESEREWVAVEVVPKRAGAASGLALILVSGRRIEVGCGFDAATLQALLRALEPA